MKTQFSKLVRFLSLLSLAFWAACPRADAQTPAQLSLQLYAGLTITGTVGTVYSIEYVTDLAHTNRSAWRSLEFLQLPASPYLWADKSAPATGQRFYRAVVFTAPTNMVFIPPGTFRMGSPDNEVDRTYGEGPQMAVTISRGYWMGKYLVTQGEYLAVMGSNPCFFNGFQPGYPAPPGGTNYGTDLTRPVEQVSWDDATNYCAQLTQRERLVGRIGTNIVYRLPTEAEWEYACRAWTSTRFSYGDDPGYTILTNGTWLQVGYTNLTLYAWYRDKSDSQTHPGGRSCPTHGACMTCMGMSMSGARIGGRSTFPVGVWLTRRGLQQARTAWFAAAAGAAAPRAAGQRSATPPARATGSSASVSGLSWPQVSRERDEALTNCQPSTAGTMKTQFSKLVRSLSVLCLALCAAAPRAAPQTPAQLDLQIYAGLTISGAVSFFPLIQR